MKVLVSPGWGIGWGSIYGIKVAIDNDLINLREQFNDEDWADLVYTYRDKIDEAFDEMIDAGIDASLDKIGVSIFNENELKLHNILLKYFADESPTIEGLANVEIQEVPKGTLFRITDYDGAEFVEIFRKNEWIEAND
jgi:hypothetical protein